MNSQNSSTSPNFLKPHNSPLLETGRMVGGTALSGTANEQGLASVPPHFLPLSGESPNGYLLRATNETAESISGVVSLTKITDRQTQGAEEILRIADTLTEPAVAEKNVRNEQTLSLLRSKHLRLAAPVAAGSVGAETYDQTQRDRHMFTKGNGAAAAETYATMLYAPTGSPAIKTAIGRSLQDKRIVNLGGGNAALRKDLEVAGTSPQSVVNVEPYPSRDVVEQPDGYDALVQANPASADFIETSGLEPHSADEILAAFSVPAYLGTEAEVINLFNNVDTMLAPRGVARISPLGIVEATENDRRLTAIYDSVDALCKKGYRAEAVDTQRGVTLLLTAPEAPQVS